MYTYPNTTQQITKKIISTTETYDDKGNLVTKETYEEIEYAPQPAAAPNQPWIISNAANTHYFDFDHPLGQDVEEAPPARGLIN